MDSKPPTNNRLKLGKFIDKHRLKPTFMEIEETPENKIKIKRRFLTSRHYKTLKNRGKSRDFLFKKRRSLFYLDKDNPLLLDQIQVDNLFARFRLQNDAVTAALQQAEVELIHG